MWRLGCRSKFSRRARQQATGAHEEETGRARERTDVLSVGRDKAHLIDQLKRVVRMAERAAADADGAEAAAAGAAAGAPPSPAASSSAAKTLPRLPMPALTTGRR